MSFEEQVAGAVQAELSGRGTALGAALLVATELDQRRSEPADDVKAVQHVLRPGQVLVDGGLVRGGSVGYYYLHAPSPGGVLIPEEPD